MTTACLRIFPKKNKKHFSSPSWILLLSSPGKRQWPSLRLTDSSSLCSSRTSRCLRQALEMHQVTPCDPTTPPPSHPSYKSRHRGTFFPIWLQSRSSMISDLVPPALYFSVLRSWQKKKRKNPATRTTIVNKMHEILNVTAAVFQAGDSCAATVDAAGPPSVKSGPLLAG